MIRPLITLNMKTVLTAFVAAAVITGCSDSVTEIADEFVHCRSLPGDRTARKIDTWKYEAIREATLEIDPGANGLTIPQFTKLLEQGPGADLKSEIIEGGFTIGR